MGVRLMPIPRVDLFMDGAWTDVSSYVQYASGLTCIRGRRAESGGMEAQTAALTFLNPAPDYPFTPDHPLSVNYGKLDRNTPIRIARDAAAVDDTESTYLYLPGVQGAYAVMADTSGVSITGDIDIRIEVALDDWTTTQDLIGKYRIDVADRSWAVWIENGILSYIWSADGAATTTASATAAITPDPGEKLTLRITHDVNNGAAGNDVVFYTGTGGVAGSFVQLGATVTTSGTTSIFDSQADLAIGDISGAIRNPMAGKVYEAMVRQGIAGTIKARPDFAAQDDQTKSFTDAAGNTWFITGAAQMITTTPGPWRFHGEVAEWPVESDVTGEFVTVAIEAAGQWRRLTQNEEPLNSAMFRAHTNPSLTRLKAYWSMEDGEESTKIASNVTGVTGLPMTVSGALDYASYDEWTASKAVVTIGNAGMYGKVAAYTATGESGCYFFFFTPSSGAPASETTLFKVQTTGTARLFDIRLLTNGNMRVKAYDDDGVAIDDGAGNLDAELGFDLFPRGFMIMNFELLQSGSDVKWYLGVNDFTNTDLATGGISSSFFSGTITGKTFGVISVVNFPVRGVALPETHVGHCAVSDQFKLTLTDVGDAVAAYNGENPATRILRLCGEEDIPCDLVSQDLAGNSVSMGDQLVKTLTELLTETENTDLGILHESRDRLALRYRTRLSMANQDPAVTLSYSSHELGDTLHPTNDDQLTVNTQYVIREKGVKAYKAKTSGKLKNTSPKAGGIGRYTAEKTVSVTYDDQVEDQTGYRLRLGTTDKPRYPQITVNLHHPSIAGTALEDGLLTIDIGDRLVVTDMPDHLPPDDADILVVGYTETFDQLGHTITFVGVPYEPWQWAVAGGDISFVNDAETLNSTSTASVTVSVPAGTQAGDVMVAFIGLISQTTITAPFGWELLDTQDAGANTRYAAYRRVASSEPASYTWSWTGSFKNSGWIGSYRGADPTDPIGDFDSNGTNVTGTGFATDAVTIPELSGLLVTAVFARTAATGSATTWTTSDGSDSERYDTSTNAGSGFDVSHAVYDSNRMLAPADVTRTLTASQAAGQVATWAVALRSPADNRRAAATSAATTASFAAGTDTALTVLTTQGPVATTDAADFPFNIRTSGVELEATAAASTGLDAFGRTASNGWSTADSGQTWTATGGVAGNFAVGSGIGTHTQSTKGVKRTTTYAAPSADFDIYVSVATSVLAAGASLAGGLTGRHLDVSNMYYLRVEFTTAAAVILQVHKFVAGVSTLLGSFTFGLAHVAGTYYRVRLSGFGSAFKAKIWLAGTPEPARWHVQFTDTALTAAQSLGCISEAFSSNSNTNPVVQFDDFEVVNPQKFTVTQAPVNGVVKTIPSGSDVQVAAPAYVGMV
jgi:hypothetical protein